MEHEKILNLINKTSDYKFMTRKWNIVNYQSSANNNVGNEIVCKTEVLKHNLCDYINAYILVRVDTTGVRDNGAEATLKNVHHSLSVSQKLMDEH